MLDRNSTVDSSKLPNVCMGCELTLSAFQFAIPPCCWGTLRHKQIHPCPATLQTNATLTSLCTVPGFYLFPDPRFPPTQSCSIGSKSNSSQSSDFLTDSCLVAVFAPSITMAAINSLITRDAVAQLVKRKNWAAREPGVVTVFAIVFVGTSTTGIC